MKTYTQIIAKELNLTEKQVENTLKLLDDGATIPFICRYRKEATGELDELTVAQINDRRDELKEIDKRRNAIVKSINEQGKMTDDIQKQLDDATSLTKLEDIYLPFKPKRKTRASIAKEKGLEPLATLLMKQGNDNPELLAQQFLNDGVASTNDAINGAKDIIAEWVSEDTKARNTVRKIFQQDAHVVTTVKKDADKQIAEKYRDYFEFSEPLKNCPTHRLMAVFRGQDDGVLSLHLDVDEDKAVNQINPIFVKNRGKTAQIVEDAVKDGYKRLLKPSIETETEAQAKARASDDSIRVFAGNLRQLLLAPPLGQKNILALDPGYRTGCKLVCLDAQGTPLHHDVIFPHPPQNEKAAAMATLLRLVDRYQIEAIAIGNGTAGRETEDIVKKVPFKHNVQVFVVSESGASIYSASNTAREEFPNLDITVRSAISIGRRLMDPLAELVKTDPQSIGVGQYQHDVDQSKLKKSLDQVVESCVNMVGVNVNTASKHLLSYVSGVGPQLAQNIINYRKEAGPFHSRNELKKVPRMGDKAFELAAGFLRIPDANNPLDNSAVHPEAYHIVQKMANDLNVNIPDLLKNENVRKQIQPTKYVTNNIGLPTLNDILKELARPGRDPRTKAETFSFDQNVRTIDDLHEGATLPGIVTNITNFGCFVDIGIKTNGLIHVSELADKFVKHPDEVVKLHQHVNVKVIGVDKQRDRIMLSMKQLQKEKSKVMA